jgi:hypothetical protein
MNVFLNIGYFLNNLQKYFPQNILTMMAVHKNTGFTVYALKPPLGNFNTSFAGFKNGLPV